MSKVANNVGCAILMFCSIRLLKYAMNKFLDET